jgi:uncharacterized protein
MACLPILSKFTVQPIFQAQKAQQDSTIGSLDLGITNEPILIDPMFAQIRESMNLGWDDLKRIRDDEQSCYEIRDGSIVKIEAFSDNTGRYYSLYPTYRAPTMLISGIPMHRIKNTDPYADTISKIKAAHPSGMVLDTTTGLGYTAIQAAQTSEQVITIELDPVVIDICQRNPWSQALFSNPRISQLIGDSFDVVQTFPDGKFSCIIHDPPTFSLAGDLYSSEFYGQVFRILKQNGRFFHYIGDLESSSGRRVARGVAQRLERAGFLRVVPQPKAFALMAYKG